MGTPLLIQWNKFHPGTSFFIPCIERRAVEKYVLAEATRLKIPVVTKQVVENNIFGLRVWRVDATVAPHSPVGL
jgi:hypothetical protein